MNRKYTREIYLEKVDKLRNTCPDIAITSDIIVGFPGEKITDFQETLDLISMVEFDGLFAFKYSDRPNASAARFSDKVPEDEKKLRLQQVLDLQDQITTRKSKTLKDSIQSVLVEGFSKKQDQINKQNSSQKAQWTGRTSTNKIVNFYNRNDTGPCSENLMGRLINVIILQTFSHSLWGEANGKEPISFGLRGEKSDVA
jgi:tRNA-2-methylthio-N6-dimethylallyladenosine synthase